MRCYFAVGSNHVDERADGNEEDERYVKQERLQLIPLGRDAQARVPYLDKLLLTIRMRHELQHTIHTKLVVVVVVVVDFVFCFTHRHLFVLDGEIEAGQSLVLLLVLLADLVEHDLELVAAAHVVEQLDGEGAEVGGQLQVLALEVLLALGQDLELEGHLERGEYGIDAGQGDVGLAAEAAIRVET